MNAILTHRTLFLFALCGLAALSFWLAPAAMATIVPASAGAGLTLDMTVGMTSDCATTTSVTVPQGTALTYCFTVTNTSSVPLSAHKLAVTELGLVLPDYAYDLAPGATLVYTTTAPATTSGTRTATWDGTAPMAYSFFTGACSPFPDITTTGVAYNLSDDGAVELALPFTFPFYDTAWSSIVVSNNGNITGAGMATPPTNEAFPNDTYRRMLAPYWDDLDDESGSVYVGPYTFFPETADARVETNLMLPPGASVGPGAVSYYVVLWHNRPHYPASTGTATFATLLAYPDQGFDGYTFSCYADTDFGDPALNHGASATVGLNHNGVNSLLYSHNIADTLLTDNGAAAYMPGGAMQTYSASDSVSVVVQPPVIDVSPDSLDIVHENAPQETITFLVIQNLGSSTLTWNAAETLSTCAGAEESVPWLSLSAEAGTVPPNREVDLGVILNSAGLEDGGYKAYICISNNDPSESLVEIEVDLRVINGNPIPPTVTPPPTSTPTTPTTATPTGSPAPPTTVTPTAPPTGENQLFLPLVRRR
jgi:hypothetical protein